MYKIVTISREFGCNARGIAQKLANALNFAYYDKDLIDLTAQKIGISREIVAAQDEVIGNKNKFSLSLYMALLQLSILKRQFLHRQKLLERQQTRKIVFFLVDVPTIF